MNVAGIIEAMRSNVRRLWRNRAIHLRSYKAGLLAGNGIGILLLVAVFIGRGHVKGAAIAAHSRAIWLWYQGQKSPSEALTPLFALAAGLAIAGVTLMRHFAQTDADRQRRIIESFSKAIEQLGSDKLEVRLGGIYALERLSQESPRDYWPVMENLTAFVRERTQRTEAERTAGPSDQRIAKRAYLLWEEAGRPEGRSEEFWIDAVEREKYGDPPATDIAAVLTVIIRRSRKHRALETRGGRAFNFRQAVMRGASLWWAHLERADFTWAHLERAYLAGAHLEDAILNGTHLEHASLMGAHLEDANLHRAHLEHAHITEAHLEGANLCEANLEGAEGLTQEQIEQASGDAETRLPAGLSHPAHWRKPAAAGWPIALSERGE